MIGIMRPRISSRAFSFVLSRVFGGQAYRSQEYLKIRYNHLKMGDAKHSPETLSSPDEDFIVGAADDASSCNRKKAVMGVPNKLLIQLQLLLLSCKQVE